MSNKNKKKFKQMLSQIGIFILVILVAFLVSAALGAHRTGNPSDFSFFEFMLMQIIFIYIAMFLGIIIHEAGHLVFGYLSGYEFISFRVGSLTIIRENNKFKFKRFSIQGTGGQCLMMPTCKDYNDIPYVLYNLGGVLFNIISAIIVRIIMNTVNINYLTWEFMNTFVIMSVIFAITNGLPLKFGGFPNDGYNLMKLSKDKDSKEGLYKQLVLAGNLNKGIRLKDMPSEFFEVNEDADLGNPLITAVKINKAAYYFDKHDFTKSKEILTDIVDNVPKLITIFKNEIYCELLFCAILENDEENIEKLYTKDLKKYIKAMRNNIGKIRLNYAYTLLIEKDEIKSKRILEHFEKTANRHPSKGEVESEKDIIKYTQQASEVILID